MSDTKRRTERSKIKGAGAQGDLRRYTQQIWLAGLGAFSRSDEEGGKFFDALVKAGEEIEHRTREAAGMVEEVRGRMREKASDTLGRVERVLDDGLSSTLGRLGIPSQRDIETLHSRLDALTELLQELRGHEKSAAQSKSDKSQDN
ncbi:MAG: phasin family protein [Pseudomonadales bacterium]|nr:phasin family protein [Pseudomonadales bacterium]